VTPYLATLITASVRAAANATHSLNVMFVWRHAVVYRFLVVTGAGAVS
jgi:hypothetical protein